jgi:hypothetical protein
VQKEAELAQAHGKKKEIAEVAPRLSDTHKNLEQKQSALDSINRTVSTDIIRPYTYTRKSVDLGAVVQLQFRIADSSGAQISSMVPILRDVHQVFTMLENVKPEDTEGVKAHGSIPDEIQFLTDVEIDARDKLIKAVRERVASATSDSSPTEGAVMRSPHSIPSPKHDSVPVRHRGVGVELRGGRSEAGKYQGTFQEPGVPVGPAHHVKCFAVTL